MQLTAQRYACQSRSGSPILSFLAAQVSTAVIPRQLLLHPAAARQPWEALREEGCLSPFHMVRVQAGERAVYSPLHQLFGQRRGEGLPVGLHGLIRRFGCSGEGSCWPSPAPLVRGTLTSRRQQGASSATVLSFLLELQSALTTRALWHVLLQQCRWNSSSWLRCGAEN